MYDGHGSTRLLTDATGTVTERYNYDAYGVMLGGNPSTLSPSTTSLLYSGETFEVDLQQQYLRARWYDQNNGRFNRLDPVNGNNFDPVSLHKYAYTHNDPVNGIDPFGTFTLPTFLTSTAVRAYLGTVLVNFTISKVVDLTTKLIFENSLRNFRLFNWWDVINLVPGQAFASIGSGLTFLSRPLGQVTRNSVGKLVGVFRKAGGQAAGKKLDKLGAAFKRSFRGGKMKIKNSRGQEFFLEEGTKDFGFKHIARRHLRSWYDGSPGSTGLTTFWPAKTSASRMLKLLQEGISKMGTPLYGGVENIVTLSNGIKAAILVTPSGKIISFYPKSGPGVTSRAILNNLVP